MFLHEPGVLWNLKQRYSTNAIYTYTGSILIAVNPFQPLPQLYEHRVMDAYSGGDPSGLPPHVYAIASAAYKKMRSEGKGQAILVRESVVEGCSRWRRWWCFKCLGGGHSLQQPARAGWML